jgi:mono/diheme cytochrome c family protein
MIRRTGPHFDSILWPAGTSFEEGFSMKKLLFTGLPFLITFISLSVPGTSAYQSNGAALFQRYCSGCHRQITRFKPETDFIMIMRNPPLPMPAFPPDRISESDAKAIAEYIQFQLAIKAICKAV